jgi:hypothetical protein
MVARLSFLAFRGRRLPSQSVRLGTSLVVACGSCPPGACFRGSAQQTVAPRSEKTRERRFSDKPESTLGGNPRTWGPDQGLGLVGGSSGREPENSQRVNASSPQPSHDRESRGVRALITGVKSQCPMDSTRRTTKGRSTISGRVGSARPANHLRSRRALHLGCQILGAMAEARAGAGQEKASSPPRL